MEYYLAIKKKGHLPFAATWMELEGIMLNEISQAEKLILSDITLSMESEKYNQLRNQAKKQQPHRHREQTSHEGKGEGGAREGRGLRGTN